jgi:uncharacterized coiled-coil protein SlyX
MTEGYIYCVSNVSMPSICNIGMSWMTPAASSVSGIIFDDMNNVNNARLLWYPPTPYKCNIAKKVLDPIHKTATIYKLLEQYRINPVREFFRISLKDVRALFELMDGEYCIDDNDNYNSDDDNDDNSIDEAIDKKKAAVKADLQRLNEDFEQRKAEIKIAEERILDCIFKKSDALENDLKKLEVRIANRKTELSEINDLVEERKVALANLTNDMRAYCDTRISRDQYTQRDQIITEY